MSGALMTPRPFASGKGKTLFEIEDPTLAMMYFRDSLSTHNIVHQSEIMGLGSLIMAQTLFMAIEVFGDDIPTHLVAWGQKIYDYVPRDPAQPFLHHHAVIVKKSRKPETELIYRAYLAGSLHKAIQETGEDPYGYGLSRSLQLMMKFPRPIFTPTAKSENDEPLDPREVGDAYAREDEVALKAFNLAAGYLEARGVALIDAKFEAIGGMLIDDWLNGSCSRMTLIADIKEGIEPPWLDKERFRQIALRKWDGGPKVPLIFTKEEAAEGYFGYLDGFRQVTGFTSFEVFAKKHLDWTG